MKKKENLKFLKRRKRLLVYLAIVLGFILVIIIFLQSKNNRTQKNQEVKNINIQDSTSSASNNSNIKKDAQVLAEGEGLEVVKTHCTSCHSAKLIVQNRATREGWLNMIRWMQQTQNLWDLGENEEVILKYLSNHYAPEEKGRRENLKDIEWYELNE